MTIAEVDKKFAQLEAEISELKARLDYTEALAGIKRGLDQADRGLGIPLPEADAKFRAKHRIPRS